MPMAGYHKPRGKYIVTGGLEQQRARFYRGASFRMPFLADSPFDAIMNEIIENLRIEKGAFA